MELKWKDYGHFHLAGRLPGFNDGAGAEAWEEDSADSTTSGVSTTCTASTPTDTASCTCTAGKSKGNTFTVMK